MVTCVWAQAKMPQANKEMNAKGLRDACRAIVSFRWKKKDGWHYLTNSDMESVSDRQKTSEVARARFGLGPVDTGAPIIKRSHMYWTSLGSSFEFFPEEGRCPAYFQVGVLSWLKLSASVIMWTHNKKLQGLPVEFIASGQLWVCDASVCLSVEVLFDS